jgi:hypothetical protein
MHIYIYVYHYVYHYISYQIPILWGKLWGKHPHETFTSLRLEILAKTKATELDP